ncbi:hypothetical protein JHK87_046636 [Glycine soja]|nr:hypothetical protein JHK87_046636 [Glycine soja]
MTKISIIITLLIAVTASCFVCVLLDRKIEGFYMVVALVTIIASAMVLAFRATMVTFITVLVLLTFAGFRRRVLIQQRWRIFLDVAWYLVSVIFRSEKGLLGLACATFISLLATYR